MVLVRQREHRLRQEADGRFTADWQRFQRELAGPGAHQLAADADVVAEIEQLVEREDVFTDVVLAHVYLQAFAALLQVREAGFALQADGHEPAGDSELGVLGFELFAGDGRGFGVVARQ